MAGNLYNLFGLLKKKKEEKQRPKLEGDYGTPMGGGTPGGVMSSDHLEGFVYNGDLIHVSSSNVTAVQYHIAVKMIMIQYKDGASWMYGNFSEQEAIAFAQAKSKMSFVWDNIKVRGSKTAHKKPAKRLT